MLWNSRDLDRFQEADQRLNDAFFKRTEMQVKEFVEALQQGLDPRITLKLLWNDSDTLSDNAALILDAAKNDDKEFFMRLGDVLRKQQENRFPYLHFFSGYHNCQALIEFFWTFGFLWLMTDEAGLQFFQNVLEMKVELHAYRKARRRLKLVKHPDLPIVAIRKDGTKPDNIFIQGHGIMKACVPCSLILRTGWSLSVETGLVKLSR